MRVVESVPGRAHHVHHVGMDHREVGEAPRGDAQDAQVVVQSRGAVFDRDALLLVIHGDGGWGGGVPVKRVRIGRIHHFVKNTR